MTNLAKQHRQNPTTLKGKLVTLKKFYLANEQKSYEICVELAANIFQDVFHNQIVLLLNAFPADHIIEETKKLFWSGLKRVPTPLNLDLNDPIHLELVQAGANIFATMFGIPMVSDQSVVVNLAKKVKLE